MLVDLGKAKSRDYACLDFNGCVNSRKAFVSNEVVDSLTEEFKTKESV